MDDDINSQDFQQTGTENFQKLIFQFPEIFCHQQGHAGSKTFHQQNPPVLNWRCWLTQVDCIMQRFSNWGPQTKGEDSEK